MKLTIYESCLSQTEQTYEGPIESLTGDGFAGIASSFLVEEIIGGCCQISATDDSCAFDNYEYGKCIPLSSKSIECSTGYWVDKARYD